MKLFKYARILLGLIAIAYALVTGQLIFLLGIIPVVSAATNFCPACYFFGKCKLKLSRQSPSAKKLLVMPQ